MSATQAAQQQAEAAAPSTGGAAEDVVDAAAVGEEEEELEAQNFWDGAWYDLDCAGSKLDVLEATGRCGLQAKYK